jgi:predicted peptidase
MPTPGAANVPPVVNGATAGTWQTGTINGLPYALLMPAQYDAKYAYPLVLYLHQLANEASIPQQCDPWFNDLGFRSQHPAIVVAPRCIGSSATYNWGGVDSGAQACQDNAIALTRQLMSTYSVDPKRVYVTGNSMGGLGSWDVIIKYPTLFAAAMPLAGANYYQDVNTVAKALSKTPIWAIHGAQDTQVPLAWDRNIASAISALGGIEKYTEIGTLGHDVWDTVYPDATYWTWLFAQSR